jgi:hypothetical protein
MDNYKQLKKLEISFESKLTRKLNNVFKNSNVNFIVKGCNGPIQFNSKETGWTLFRLGCVRDCNNLVLDFTFHFQIENKIPQVVLENKNVLLSIINSELNDYFSKQVALY